MRKSFHGSFLQNKTLAYDFEGGIYGDGYDDFKYLINNICNSMRMICGVLLF